MRGTQVVLCSPTLLGAPPETTFPPESQLIECLTSGVPERKYLLRSYSACSPKQLIFLPVISGTRETQEGRECASERETRNALRKSHVHSRPQAKHVHTLWTS